MKVMIVVTHLLGTGHLARALTLGRAFREAGHAVTVVSGGMPVPHFDGGGMHLVQLPPLRSDGTDFTRLLDDTGAPASESLFAARRAMLIDTLHAVAPDVLITELFPFGRRTLRGEFIALLEAARQPGRTILCSIRDILAPPGKPAKAEMARDLVTRFYDAVLVHSDPALIPLDRSWPVTPDLAARLVYTGFVAPPPPPPEARGDTILVSAGGGAVGDRIFAAAIEAAQVNHAQRWHLLVGGSDTRRGALRKVASANVTVDAPRPDFRSLMSRAAASVSMCGYNTAMDVLQTGVPAVLVPFDDGNEVEQGLRADALGQLPGVAVVRQAALDGGALASAVASVRAAPARPPQVNGMDGAARTVEWVEGMRGDR